MMALLSGLLTGAVGKYAAAITIPLLVLGSIVLGHWYVQERDAKQVLQTTAKRDADWEIAIRKQERDVARGATQAAQDLLEAERKLNEGLNNELTRITVEYEELRRAAAPDDCDPERCLSDSVLRSIGGPGSDGAGGQPAKGRSGRGGSKK